MSDLMSEVLVVLRIDLGLLVVLGVLKIDLGLLGVLVVLGVLKIDLGLLGVLGVLRIILGFARCPENLRKQAFLHAVSKQLSGVFQYFEATRFETWLKKWHFRNKLLFIYSC